MKRFFDIDLPAFARSLLPTALRVPLVCSFVGAVCNPFYLLYFSFMDNRRANLYRLGITSQVCYLEKALNDRFDVAQRRIYIGGGSLKRRTYLYTRVENFPVIVYTPEENAPVYLYLRDEGSEENADFIVYVPAGLAYDDNEMRALLDYYKLASKTYLIKVF